MSLRKWVLVSAGPVVALLVGFTAVVLTRGGESAGAVPSQARPDFYFVNSESARDEALGKLAEKVPFQPKPPPIEVAGLRLAVVGVEPGSALPGQAARPRLVSDYYRDGFAVGDDSLGKYNGVRVTVVQLTGQLLLDPAAEKLGTVGNGYELAFVFEPQLGREAGGEYQLRGQGLVFLVTAWSTERPIRGVPTATDLAPLFEALAR